MPIAFPSTPSNGDSYSQSGKTWVYNATAGSWEGGAGSAYQLALIDATANGLSISRRVNGVHVDDFYESSHGTDDAISIRAAFAYALANGLTKVTFSPKTYLLQSNVSTETSPNIYPIGFNSTCSVKIESSAWTDIFVIEGNGARLFKTGTDYADIMCIRAMFKRLIIRNLGFIRDNSMNSASARAGLNVECVSMTPEIEHIEISNCHFSDCH